MKDAEATRQVVIRFAKTSWHEHRSVPSVRTMMTSCNVKSTREFYNLFPGRLSELCKEAGIPPPGERLRITGNASKARHGGDSEEAGPRFEASVFELLEKGTSLPQIVASRGRPDLVLELFKKWRRLKEVDVNQPAVLKELKNNRSDLLALKDDISKVEESARVLGKNHEGLLKWIETSFEFWTCTKCGAGFLKPKFVKPFPCPSCKEVFGEQYTAFVTKKGRLEDVLTREYDLGR